MSAATTTIQDWSRKQIDIFDHFINFYLINLVVRARAGTGKTTTICEAVRRLLRADPKRVIAVAAFGRAIADELSTRFVGYDVTVATLHAIGLRVVRRMWPNVQVEDMKDSKRADFVTAAVCDASTPKEVKKLITKLHTKGREISAHARMIGDLTDLAIRFECEPTLPMIAEGFDLVFIEQKALDAMEYAASKEPTETGIDGSDMLFLPVRNGWLRQVVDDIIVDEAQDMNPTQLEIAVKVAKRVIVVGDDKQGIFAFRGADSEALDRLKTELNAVELPLNVTYRCCKAVVREAQVFVPDFQAGDDNPEGEVRNIVIDALQKEAQPGDFILSRSNAPLVSIAISLLRSGKRARINGRNIGKGLVTLLQQMKARSIPELLRGIEAWRIREKTRLDVKFEGKDKENPPYITLLDEINDKADMLLSLTDNAHSVSDVIDRIETLFADKGIGAGDIVTCSSVHRAKGLEANRVFVLAKSLRTNNQEERNICYVAITRAKNSLIYVHPE